MGRVDCLDLSFCQEAIIQCKMCHLTVKSFVRVIVDSSTEIEFVQLNWSPTSDLERSMGLGLTFDKHVSKIIFAPAVFFYLHRKPQRSGIPWIFQDAAWEQSWFHRECRLGHSLALSLYREKSTKIIQQVRASCGRDCPKSHFGMDWTTELVSNTCKGK